MANPGWYEDPEDASGVRFFDGLQWTDRTSADGTVKLAAMSASNSPPEGQARTLAEVASDNPKATGQPRWAPVALALGGVVVVGAVAAVSMKMNSPETPAAPIAVRELTFCDKAMPLVSRMSQPLSALANGARDQATIDAIADTLIALHPLLIEEGMTARAASARDAVAKAGSLPLGTSASSGMDRLNWGFAAVGVHDAVITHCQQPDRDAAEDRRSDFLDSD